MKIIRVLFVAPNEENFFFIKQIFQEMPHRERYQLTWINHYDQAINAMLKSYHDIYLLNHQPDCCNGIELLNEAIKSNVEEPIILISDNDDADHIALEIGASDYLIRKEITPGNLEKSLRYNYKKINAWSDFKNNANKYRTIYERIQQAVFIFDHHTGKLIEANREAKNLLGIDVALFSASIDDFFISEYELRLFSDTLSKNGSTQQLEVKLRNLKNNKIQKISISAFLQIDQHATKALCYCVIRDSPKYRENLYRKIQDPLSAINLAVFQLQTEITATDDLKCPYLEIVSKNLLIIKQLLLTSP